MTKIIGNTVFGNIKNVRKSGDYEGVYFADVELAEAEGFPLSYSFYTATHNDYALTGKWVYQQIIDGNFDGNIEQLPPTPNSTNNAI